MNGDKTKRIRDTLASLEKKRKRIQKIEKLVRAGATVVGPKPIRANGLTAYPQRDQQVKELAGQIWGPVDGENSVVHTYGKGQVVHGRTLREILIERGVGPDFQFTSSRNDTALDYIHRRTPEADIYFVRNVNARPASVEATFRVTGRAPECWDPQTGRHQIVPVYEQTALAFDYDRLMERTAGRPLAAGRMKTAEAVMVAGLMTLIGKDLFNDRLEMQFEESQKTLFGGGEEIDSFSGLEKLYNHGNQPCLHNAWLFNYSGKSWLTQLWTRAICNDFYGTEPLHGYGYGQDEDQGQLGAWYVMASIGLFDVQGHTASRPTFQLGSPLFDKITIDLNSEYYSADKLEIIVENNENNHPYVQSATIGGHALDKPWFYRDELIQSGKLRIIMGPEPNENWENSSPPPSMSSMN